ncbi:MAG: ABC transporter substrate-binding protein [Bdellovibrionota bacterium]
MLLSAISRITSFHAKGSRLCGKAFALSLLTLAACSPGKNLPSRDRIRVLIDQAPATLNPRTSLDAAGQRINALVYSALTRIDPALEPIPDLSEKWTNHGNDVVFTLKKGLHDHAGQPITSEDMRACLENYRITKPVSPYRAAFPQWTATEAQGQTVTLKLKEPNPYIARNVSLLRFFRVPGAATPCSEPEPGREVIGSGPYRFEKWEIQPDTSVTLLPVEHPERPKLEIAFIYDYTAGAMKLLRGEADAILTALSLTKTEWIKREHADQFRVLERNGIGVNYLNYNLKDPILSHAEVRRAIALAIDRPTIVRDKLLNYCDVADSLLSPGLPEASPQKFTYDPGEAARLLDQAGFPLRGSARFTIKLKTSATKEAVDMALILRDHRTRGPRRGRRRGCERC